MTDDRIVLATLLGVLLVLVGLMVMNQAAVRRARAEAAAKQEAQGRRESDLLLKFAVHDGDVVGETVAVDGERLVLKQAGVFKAVPLALAEVEGREVRLRGRIDWDAALREGAQWHERSTRGHDPEVTQDLTRSEDVRAPALEALRRRGEDEDLEGSDGPADAARRPGTSSGEEE